eukprot:6983226-Prymnesium_polylepis.1
MSSASRTSSEVNIKGSCGRSCQSTLSHSGQGGVEDMEVQAAEREVESFWPPWRQSLYRATIECLSLHNCPSVRHRMLPFSTSFVPS